MKVELTIKNDSVHFEIGGASVTEPLSNFPAAIRHFVESKRVFMRASTHSIELTQAVRTNKERV